MTEVEDHEAVRQAWTLTTLLHDDLGYVDDVCLLFQKTMQATTNNLVPIPDSTSFRVSKEKTKGTQGNIKQEE